MATVTVISTRERLEVDSQASVILGICFLFAASLLVLVLYRVCGSVSLLLLGSLMPDPDLIYIDKSVHPLQ